MLSCTIWISRPNVELTIKLANKTDIEKGIKTKLVHFIVHCTSFRTETDNVNTADFFLINRTSLRDNNFRRKVKMNWERDSKACGVSIHIFFVNFLKVRHSALFPIALNLVQLKLKVFFLHSFSRTLTTDDANGSVCFDSGWLSLADRNSAMGNKSFLRKPSRRCRMREAWWSGTLASKCGDSWPPETSVRCTVPWHF